jgi:hypothetical protein
MLRAVRRCLDSPAEADLASGMLDMNTAATNTPPM